MAGMFSSPKASPQVIETTPTIIDNTKKTQELESKRRKKRGIGTQFVAGNTSLSGNSVRKTLLGE